MQSMIVGPLSIWRRRQRRVCKLLRRYRGVPIIAGKNDLHKAVEALENVTELRYETKRNFGGNVSAARRAGLHAATLSFPLSLVWYCLLDIGRWGKERDGLGDASGVPHPPSTITGQRARACWYARQLADMLEEQAELLKKQQS